MRSVASQGGLDRGGGGGLFKYSFPASDATA